MSIFLLSLFLLKFAIIIKSSYTFLFFPQNAFFLTLFFLLPMLISTSPAFPKIFLLKNDQSKCQKHIENKLTIY